MNDEQGRREAFAISWSEPNVDQAQAAWSGPAPDAVPEPAPQPEQATPAPRPGSMSQAWASWTSAAPAADETPAPQPSNAPAPQSEHRDAEHPDTEQHDAVGERPLNSESLSTAQAFTPESQPAPFPPARSAGTPAGVNPAGADSAHEAAGADLAGFEQTDAERENVRPAGGEPVEAAMSSDEHRTASVPQTQKIPAQERSGSSPAGQLSQENESPQAEAESTPQTTPPATPQDVEPDEGHGYDQSFMDAPSEEHDFPQAPAVEPAGTDAQPQQPSMESAGAPSYPEPSVEDAAADHEQNAGYPHTAEAEAPAPLQPSESEAASAEAYGSTPPQVIGHNEDIPEDALTIGRSRTNVIVLDDMLVSREHVVITADEDGLLMRDLGSRNGTYVNGERVEQRHLNEGDRISIGASTFEVRDGWLVSV